MKRNSYDDPTRRPGLSNQNNCEKERRNLFRQYYIKSLWRFYRVRFLLSTEACLFDIQEVFPRTRSHHVVLVLSM